jgi:hypothetical protein
VNSAPSTRSGSSARRRRGGSATRSPRRSPGDSVA